MDFGDDCDGYEPNDDAEEGERNALCEDEFAEGADDDAPDTEDDPQLFDE